MIPIRYNLRSLAVRKGTSFATSFGMALVVFVLSSAMMLVDGVNRILATSGRADNAIVLRPGANEQDSAFDMTKLNTVLTQPGIKRDESGPMIIGEVVALAHLPRLHETRTPSPGATVPFRLTTENGLKFRPEMRVVEGVAPKPGTDEVMFGKALQNRIKGLQIGQTIQIRRKPLRVVGMFEAGGSSYESEVWGDASSLTPIFSLDGILSSIRVRLDSPAALDSFRAAVESNKALGLHVEREDAYFEKQSEGLATMFGAMGGTISILAAVGAMIGAMITMYSAVATRQREIGTLRAIGYSRGSIVLSFLIEAVVLTGVGGALGTVASLAMSLVHFSTLNTATYTDVVLSFDPSARTILTAVTVAAVLGVIGGLLPAIRAARVSAVTAMRA